MIHKFSHYCRRIGFVVSLAFVLPLHTAENNVGAQGAQERPAASPIEECGDCPMPTSDIVFNLNRMDPVKFSHVKHLSVDPGKTAKQTGFSCKDCHPNPFARVSKGPIGMEVPHEEGGCTQCHNGQKRNGITVFAANTRCLTCHRSATQP